MGFHLLLYLNVGMFLMLNLHILSHSQEPNMAKVFVNKWFMMHILSLYDGYVVLCAAFSSTRLLKLLTVSSTELLFF